MQLSRMTGMIALLALTAISYADITGTVTDAAGNPLEGVTVSRSGYNDETTTNAAGQYTLTSVGIRPSSTLSNLSQSITLKDNVLFLSPATATSVSAKLFDLRGKLIATIFDGRIAAGANRLPLSLQQYGDAMYLMQVTMGSAASTFKIATNGSSSYSATAHVSNQNVGQPVASVNADGEIWISAAKSGYIAHVAKEITNPSTIDFTLEPMNAPDFGPNVKIYNAQMNMAMVQSELDAIYAVQDSNQFGNNRYAYFFKPGNYNPLLVKTGFYTSVLGLGESPDDVTINGDVRVIGDWMPSRNCTQNFWRATENLAIVPTINTFNQNLNQWAVSQATAYRRVHVKGKTWLFDLDVNNNYNAGWASGGFFADSKFDSTVFAGSQQQWINRNCEWGAWDGAVWNMVFLGCPNPPTGTWPTNPITTIAQTPVIREKPFLFLQGDNYAVKVPALHTNTSGITWGSGISSGTVLTLDRFYIAHAGIDSAGSINAMLALGYNILLTPGIYHLSESLNVTQAGTIVMGIGYPTLLADGPTAALNISDVDGVTICGMLVEAGMAGSPTLIRVGEDGASASHADNPTFLFDIFCRVGGVFPGKTDCCMTINSKNVVGENFWLWRADHGAGAAWDQNVNDNGLIVNGDDVTIYGLFVEHNQKYQTVWNGNGGRTYFYQSETPYDVPNQAAWSHDGVNGYASYKVADNVTTHEAWGVGVYCFFRDNASKCERAIEVPEVPGVKMHHLVTRWLDGLDGSEITHVINNRGDAVTKTSVGATVE